MAGTGILPVTSLLGLGTSLYVSGISFSASHLTLPILYRMPTEFSTSFFEELYHRGARTVVPLAGTSAILSGASAYLDSKNRLAFTVAACMTFSLLPWTGVMMMGVNERLIFLSKEPAAREKAGGEILELLKRWKWMNMVRAGLAAGGGILGLLVVATKL